jgi:hypothetical protein
MVLTPLVRGLFGVTVHDGTITVDPHLPADWPAATLRHVPVGNGQHVAMVFDREGGTMAVGVVSEEGTASPKLKGATQVEEQASTLRVPLPGVEIVLPSDLPLPGARAEQLKVLEQQASSHSASWTFEAQGGGVYQLPLRLNGIKSVQVTGATLIETELAALEHEPEERAKLTDNALEMLEVHFPAGKAYTQQTVTVRW